MRKSEVTMGVRRKEGRKSRKRRKSLWLPVVFLLPASLLLIVLLQRKNTGAGEAGGTVAALQAGGNAGSCVLYEIRPEGCLFLTAAHVLADEEQVFVTFQDGSVAGGTVLLRSGEEDIGAVLVPEEQVPEKLRSRLIAARRETAAYEALRQGTLAACRGAKTDGTAVVIGGTVTDSWRYVADFDLNMLYLSCRAEAGMSGGAALDGEGRFLGLILGGNGSETVCLPLAAVENWAARLN